MHPMHACVISRNERRIGEQMQCDKREITGIRFRNRVAAFAGSNSVINDYVWTVSFALGSLLGIADSEQENIV